MPRFRTRLDAAERAGSMPPTPHRPAIVVTEAARRRCLLELRSYARTDDVRERIDTALAGPPTR